MNINVSQLAPRFHGLWIALADDEKTVLASGKTADEVWKKARKKHPATVIITQLPEDDEIPNDDLLESMRLAEEEEKAGKLKFYDTAEEFLASLD